ncbi:MAG: flagellar export chaperone FliS [Nitrospirota bacterium]
MNNGYNHYHELNVTLASPERLVVILYEEMACSVTAAKRAFLADNHKIMNKYLSKGIEILLELMSTLNLEAGGAVALQLADYYQLIIKKIFTLRCQPALELFDEVLHLLTPLKEAWESIAVSPFSHTK